MGLIQYTGMKYLNRIYAYGKPTYELWGRKRSIFDVTMTSNLSQGKNCVVNPQILGTNAQKCHKIIELTLATNQDTEVSTKEKVQKFRYCSEESLMRVKNEVAKKCKILRLIRGKKKHPSIYNYPLLRKLYYKAKVKCIRFNKRNRKRMVVKTVQAQVEQVTSQFENELRKEGGRGKQTKTAQELFEKLQRMDKLLYKVWEEEKQIIWAKWVRKK